MSSPLYFKTEKGRIEIDTRAGGLPAKLRRLLIMIDGRKTVGDLMSQTGLSMDMDSLILQLREEGYIDLAGAALQSDFVLPDSVPAAASLPDLLAMPAVIQAAPEYGPVSADDLSAMRRLMLDCARIYLGLMGADLMRRIDAADSEERLRACVPAWHMAMRESKAGRVVAEVHFQTVRDILHAEDE